MSSDWRNRWRQSRWVTIADFPLLTLDINPETYEGGHPDAGRRGDELLKQAFAAEADRIGIKLRMRIQHGYPLHKARHLVRMSCHPGEYRPDDMDREVFMRDAIAFAVDEGWAVPGWLHSLIVDAPSSVVSPTTLKQSAGEQGGPEGSGELLGHRAGTLSDEPTREDLRPLPLQRWQEDLILRLIREEGHDPTRLPDRKPGRAGVKAVVRPKFPHSDKVFKSAWERLRASGEIAGGK